MGRSNFMKQKTSSLEQIINEIILSFVGVYAEQYDCIINEALKKIGIFFNSDRVYIFDYELDKDTCSNTFEWCASEIEPMIEDLQNIPLNGLNFWTESHFKGEAINIYDVLAIEKGHQVREILEPQGVQSLLAIPLMNQNRCEGFLGLDAVRQKRSYTTQEIELLKKFGEVLSIFLEKQKNEQELTQIKALLSSVVDNQKEIVFRIDNQTKKITFINKSFIDVIQLEFGLTIDDYINKSTLFSEQELKEVNSKTKNNLKYVIQKSLITKNGDLLEIMWEFYLLLEINEIQIVGFDITDIVRVNQAYQRSEDQRKYILEKSGVGSWEYNLEANSFNVDQSFARLLGYTQEEVNTMSLENQYQLFHPEEVELINGLYHKLSTKQMTSFNEDMRVKHRGGTYLWVTNHGRIIEYNKQNKPSKIFGIYIDITKQKEKEIEDKTIIQTLENTYSSIVITDEKSNILFVNHAFEEYTGYTFEEVKGKTPSILKSGKHDTEFYSDMYQQLKKEHKWLGKFCNKRKDGSLYWERVTISAILDSKKNIIRYVAIKEDITDNIKIEELERKILDQMVKFSKQVPGAIYQFKLEKDGRITFPMSSDGIYSIYEVTPEQALEDASIVFTRIIKQDRKRVLDKIYLSAENLEIWEDLYQVDLPTNGLRWIKGIASPEKQEDGSVLWHGYLQDVSEEITVKEKLRISEERFRLALDATDVGLWDWNLETHEIIFSDKWKSMLGYTPDEIQDDFQGWQNLWHPNDIKKIEMSMDTYLNNKTDKYENVHRLRHKDGDYRWVMARGGVIKNQLGKSIRWVGTHIDITERINNEEQLTKINDQLKQAKEEVINASELKSRFLANITHEIRTPMNAILGYCHLLSYDNLTLEQKDKVEHIVSSGEYLLQLIDEVLDLAKVEAGKLTIFEQSFSMNEIIDNVEKMIKPASSQKNLKLSIVGQFNNISFISDKTKIKQVLINLLTNAVKYTSEGSVVLEVTYTKKNENTVDVLFVIADTGAGIGESKLPYIFEPFYQQRSVQTTGVGLGLPIAKRIVEALGGSIFVNSIENKGSVFYVHLPLKLDSKNTNDQIFKENIIEFNQSIDVLLFDNNTIQQKVFFEVLIKAKANVWVANDFIEAEQLISKRVWDIVLIHVDDAMDNTKIDSFVKKILNENIKVGIIKSKVFNDLPTGLSSGCSFVEPAPISPKRLVDQINETLVITKGTGVSFNKLNLTDEFLEGLKRSVLSGNVKSIEESIRLVEDIDERYYNYLLNKQDLFDYSSILEWIKQQKGEERND